MSLWVFLLALRIGEGELEVGEKGSADPAGRIGLAGGPLLVSLPSQVIGEGKLERGKGSADQQEKKGLLLLKLALGGLT